VIPEKVRRVLDAHGLTAIEFEEGSTPTAPLAAEKLGVGVGNIAKSLLFLGKDGRYFLVVCPGDRRISNGKLKAEVGVKTRMAGPEEVRRLTGFPPGGVCPFGIEGVDILLDEHLGAYGTIYPAAGTDASGVPMSFETLRRITGGRVCDLTAE
jgi:prolyl-tRNA editing enzyme YbaK/EbsC (Cys-tRNA(Pro) deacylase)